MLWTNGGFIAAEGHKRGNSSADNKHCRRQRRKQACKLSCQKVHQFRPIACWFSHVLTFFWKKPWPACRALAPFHKKHSFSTLQVWQLPLTLRIAKQKLIRDECQPMAVWTTNWEGAKQRKTKILFMCRVYFWCLQHNMNEFWKVEMGLFFCKHAWAMIRRENSTWIGPEKIAVWHDRSRGRCLSLTCELQVNEVQSSYHICGSPPPCFHR